MNSDLIPFMSLKENNKHFKCTSILYKNCKLEVAVGSF